MRVDRLSARVHAVKNYLRQVRRDTTRTKEDKEYLLVQTGKLLREFQGASASELQRLRAALELLEVGRDRTQPWEVRGPALDRGARILASLGIIRARHKGKTIPPLNRRLARSVFSAQAGRVPEVPEAPEDATGSTIPAEDGPTVEEGEDEGDAEVAMDEN